VKQLQILAESSPEDIDSGDTSPQQKKKREVKIVESCCDPTPAEKDRRKTDWGQKQISSA
jgi:hypothetical protein